MTVTVREAGERDVEGIRGVGLLTWPPTYLPLADADYVVDGLAQWWSAAAVHGSVASGQTLVAVDGERIIGVAVVGAGLGGRWLWKLYVMPEHQGRGVGSELMTAVLASWGGESLHLSHIEGNESARRFYERWGFVANGEVSVSSGRDHPVMVRHG